MQNNLITQDYKVFYSNTLCLPPFTNQTFKKGTHYQTKIKSALTGDYEKYIEDSLLSRKIQDNHSKFLIEKCKNKISNHKGKGLDAERLFNRFKFMTIIDSLIHIDHEKVIERIKKFKKQLKMVFRKKHGLWVLGAIEVEIINMSNMRSHQAPSNDHEYRKLNLCEELLIRDNLLIDQRHTSYALIHFHGIIYSENEKTHDDLNSVMGKQKNWNFSKRQHQITGLTRYWRDKLKPLRTSLSDICKYLTKGGTDRVGQHVYLRYKHGYTHLDSSENTTEPFISTINLPHQLENTHVKSVDPMSWNCQEIAFMARLTNSMMYFEKKPKNEKLRDKGYIIFIANRSARKKKSK